MLNLSPFWIIIITVLSLRHLIYRIQRCVEPHSGCRICIPIIRLQRRMKKNKSMELCFRTFVKLVNYKNYVKLNLKVST